MKGENRMKRVIVADLKDQIGMEGPRPSLWCRHCGAEYSAHAGDYFMQSPNHVFKCCGRNMVLATRRVVHELAKG